MEELFFWVLTLSLTCGAAVGLALLLLPKLKRRYAAGTAYVLWLVLALRLVTPFSFAMPQHTAVILTPPVDSITMPSRAETPVQEALPGDGEPTAPAAQPAAGAAVPPGVIVKEKNTVSLPRLLSAVWLIGVVITLAWQAGGYAWVRRRLLKGAEPAGEKAEALLQRLNDGKAISLYTAPVDTPMILGLFRPVLLLPREPLPVGELELALRHELAHLARRDVAYKALMALACVLHWFNPLVWRMAREAGRTVEACCDDTVVAGRDGAFRAAYGRALLHTASEKPIPFTTCFGGGKEQLRERIQNLFSAKRNGPAVVCLLLCTALGLGLAISCTGEKPNVYTGYWYPFELKLPTKLGTDYGAVVDYTGETVMYVLEDGSRAELVTVKAWNTQDFESAFGKNGEFLEERVGTGYTYLGKQDGMSFYLSVPAVNPGGPGHGDETYLSLLNQCKALSARDFSFTKGVMPHLFFGCVVEAGEDSLLIQPVEYVDERDTARRTELGLTDSDFETGGFIVYQPDLPAQTWPVDRAWLNIRFRGPEAGKVYPISEMEYIGDGGRRLSNGQNGRQVDYAAFRAELELNRSFFYPLRVHPITGEPAERYDRVFAFWERDGSLHLISETDQVLKSER